MSNNSEDPPTPPNLVPLAPSLQLLRSARKITFPDLEMSGGDPERHRIIQTGAVLARFPSLKAVACFEEKVKPGTLRDCQWQALRIARFSRERWKGAVGIHKALRSMRGVIAGNIVAFWDGSQDLQFLYATYERTEVIPPKALAYLDVQKWAQDRLNLPNRPALKTVANLLKIDYREHDALEDSKAAYHVFRMLWQYGPGELEAVVSGLEPERKLSTDGIWLNQRGAFIARQKELVKYLSSDPTVFMRHQDANNTRRPAQIAEIRTQANG